MQRKFKLKIYGDTPRSLLLALFLTKFNCDVYLFDFLPNSNINKNDQILSFSNFSKDLLTKYDLWNEFEEISYCITSFSIVDNIVSKKLLLRSHKLSKEKLNTIGWTVSYSDLKRLLINKLKNFDNVHFNSTNQLNDKSLIFDYVFKFVSYEKISDLFRFRFSIFKQKKSCILIFNVYLRGNIENRLYTINTNEGLLILTPISKNLYQITWNNASTKFKERSLNSKSFFLDNLTSLLPNDLKIDQIIGNIKTLYVSNISHNYFIKNKFIYFNENKFQSNILYDFNFDNIFKIILHKYNMLENTKSKSIKFINNLGFYYLFGKYIEYTIKFSFVSSLINLFMLNNILTLFLRKLLFILVKRIHFLKMFIFRNFLNSNIKSFTK